MYYSDDYLCHYGVLGMKWGQHLFGKSSSGSGSGRKSRSSSSKSSNQNSTASRIKSGAKAAGNWAYAHRKQILLTGVAVLATAAASPYIAMGARAAGSAISNLMDTSTSSLPKYSSNATVYTVVDGKTQKVSSSSKTTSKNAPNLTDEDFLTKVFARNTNGTTKNTRATTGSNTSGSTGSNTSSSTGNVSKEYLDAIEFNSRTTKYPNF